MSSPCNPNVSGAGNLPEKDAEALLQQLSNRAKIRSSETGRSIQDSLRNIAGEIKASQDTMKKIYERNTLLNIRAKNGMKDMARRFGTFGEGLRAFLVGSNKVREGGRLSVDYQSKAVHGKYFGKLVSSLEASGVLRDFKKASPEFVQDVYREMGAMTPGQPAKMTTKNEAAFKTAQAIDSVYAEMIARQNRAGAFITRMPGYVIRQTHDVNAIRSVGSLGNNTASMHESYKNWSEFVKPLLDNEKTFQGTDVEKTLRNIHEALYTGKHGPAHEENDVGYAGRFSDLGAKISKARVLHFKDADSAYNYNQAFGIKNFREAVLSDVHSRARQIALLENMGPHFERNFEEAITELQEEARAKDDSAKHIDSLTKDWRLKADYNELTGKNEWSANPTLSKYAGFLRVNAQLSKMGAVVLSSVTDLASTSREMAYQGMSSMQAVGGGLARMVKSSPDQQQMARSMGVGMEALIGNALSRFQEHSTVYGWTHTTQKFFYDLSLLPRWNDSVKGAVATTMANHLGENSHLAWKDLPGELRQVLTQYDISDTKWNALRNTAYDHNGSKFITPDQLHKIPDARPIAPAIRIDGEVFQGTSHFDAMEKAEKQEIDTEHAEHGWVNELGAFKTSGGLTQLTGPFITDILKESGLKPSDTNIARMRDRLETSLTTYFMDRADIAVPTPGAAERKYATWNTQAGTPLGEAMRLMMMFKSFPITTMRKVIGRDVYGGGSDSVKQWLLNDHRGKFNMAMTVAMMTIGGYVAQSLHDLSHGKTPRELVTDGKVNWDVLRNASVQGGSLGLVGDMVMGDFDHNYRSYLQYAAGPVLGQLDDAFAMKKDLQDGKNVSWPATKLLLNNAPFANLFYIRPIMDYIVLWHMQEMMSPGSLERMESRTETNNHQHYLIKPSDHK